MAVNTEMSSITIDLDDIPATTGVVRHFLVSASNVIGYFSGIIRFTSATHSLVKITLLWRPRIDDVDADHANDDTHSCRWLAVFLDLETQAGLAPNYAIFDELTTLQLNTPYNFFLVNPETPSSVPLLLDSSTPVRRGFFLKLIVENTHETSELDLEGWMRVFHTEMA